MVDVFELGFGPQECTQQRRRTNVFDVPWMPNSSSRVCLVCKDKFGVFRKRRHHCRLCGQLVCNACSQARSFVRKRDTKLERTCINCSATLRQLVDLGDTRVSLVAAQSFETYKPRESMYPRSVLSTCKFLPQSQYYVVSAAWYQRHTSGAISVGPVSNHTLLYFFEGKLHPKPSLKPTDYILLSEDKWLSLLAVYGGGPCITSASTTSKWIIHINTRRSESNESFRTFTDTVISVSEVPIPEHQKADTKARDAAAAFTAAFSLARREAETLALRKSISCVADFEDLRQSRQSFTSRFSMY